MEDKEKKNNTWVKIKILTKHSFNLICGYVSKLFFTEIFFIRLNDYLSVNRWTGKVHMRPSAMCKKFKGKDIKEIKVLLKYAFISGFESIQYNSGRLIFSHRKIIRFDTHDYIITKFEDINNYNDSNKQFSKIEYTKTEDDPAKDRRVIENLAAYKLPYLFKMKSHAIEKLIATKNKGKVTIKIEDITNITKYLRNPREIRRNKIKEKSEMKKSGGIKLEKVKEKEKGLTSKNKVYIGIFLGVLFGLIGPIIINELYKPSIYCVSNLTLWDAADLLQYYGTLLGAAATIIAVVFTIIYAQKSSQEDRRHSEKINHRNIGIQICLDFIDSCNPIKMVAILDSIEHVDYCLDNGPEAALRKTQNELDGICDKIRTDHVKFQIIYPNLDKKINSYITEYVENYSGKIENVGINLRINDGNIEFHKDILSELKNYCKTNYPALAETLRRVIFTYDCDY